MNLVELTHRSRGESLLSSAQFSPPPGAPGSSKEPVTIEPKTFFANERTFIQWISAGLLLLTVSSVMIGSGGYNTTSSVIALSALVLVAYSSYSYFRRVQLLQSGTPYGYLDYLGPSILAIGVGVGIFIVFADAVKGSEFLEVSGKDRKNEDDRRTRFLEQTVVEPPIMTNVLHQQDTPSSVLRNVPNKCWSTNISGINLLEFQPRDLVMSNDSSHNMWIASTQSLVSHSAVAGDILLASLPDMEFSSLVSIEKEDRLLGLVIGPKSTLLVELSSITGNIRNQWTLKNTPSHRGSMVHVPVAGQPAGRLYIDLDGHMHAYEMPSVDAEIPTISQLSSINSKVLNHGLPENSQVSSMEQHDGFTYMLYDDLDLIRVWDLTSSTLVGEINLPSSGNGQWAGMTLSRQAEKDQASSHLRRLETKNEGMLLHLALDAFPPQIWTFRLAESSFSSSGSSLQLFDDCLQGF